MPVDLTCDDAVSTVFGTLLMIALTITLASVLAASVIGWVNMPESKIPAVIVHPDTNGYTITWYGGDINRVVGYIVTDGTEIKGEFDKPDVGKSEYIEGRRSGETIIVVAKFDDGTEQVVFQRTF